MTAVCDRLESAFLWPDYALQKLIDAGWSLSHVGRCLRRLSMSTAFSGIDAPGVAAALICKRYGLMTGDTVQIPNLAAIELTQECRAELQLLPEPPRCLYGDILAFASPLVLQKVQWWRE